MVGCNQDLGSQRHIVREAELRASLLALRNQLPSGQELGQVWVRGAQVRLTDPMTEWVTNPLSQATSLERQSGSPSDAPCEAGPSSAGAGRKTRIKRELSEEPRRPSVQPEMVVEEEEEEVEVVDEEEEGEVEVVDEVEEMEVEVELETEVEMEVKVEQETQAGAVPTGGDTPLDAGPSDSLPPVPLPQPIISSAQDRCRSSSKRPHIKHHVTARQASRIAATTVSLVSDDEQDATPAAAPLAAATVGAPSNTPAVATYAVTTPAVGPAAAQGANDPQAAVLYSAVRLQLRPRWVDPLVGCVVWAKLPGFPSWPAVVRLVRESQAQVRFCGTHDLGVVAKDKLVYFSEQPTLREERLGDKGRWSSALWLGKFDAAVAEATARVDGSWEAQEDEEEDLVEESEEESEEEVQTQEVEGDDVTRHKRVRCRECSGCLTTDCGECKHCLDKSKFGGPDTIRQACVHRTCEQLRGRPEGLPSRRDGPRWQPTAEQKARWASCWASCDRCGKWRLLRVDASELPTGEWWCGHAICDSARSSCHSPQELTEAQIDGEAMAQFAAGFPLQRSKQSQCTHGYRGVNHTGWGVYQAKGRGGALLGTYKTAVEASVCFARYCAEEEEKDEEEPLQLELSSTLKTGYAGVAALSGGLFRATSQDGVCLGRRFVTAADAAVARATHGRELNKQVDAEEREESQQSWHSCWVSCDRCSQWRLLLGMRDNELPPTWVCEDSPDPSHNHCEQPEAVEADDDCDELATQAAGWSLHIAEGRSSYVGVCWRASRLTKPFEAANEAGHSLGFFLTAVEAAICVARFKQQLLLRDASSLPLYGTLPALSRPSRNTSCTRECS